MGRKYTECFKMKSETETKGDKKRRGGGGDVVHTA